MKEGYDDLTRNSHKNQKVFDIETTNKQIVFLKGIGRRCLVCNKHLFGRLDKKTCSQKCRSKMRYEKTGKEQTNTKGLHAFIQLQSYKENNSRFRILKLYLIKGIVEEVKITPESKELWSLLEKIEQFRDISKPLVEITA